MKKIMFLNMMFLVLLGSAAGANGILLIDRYVDGGPGGNPQSFSEWNHAGVMGDLSNAAAGTVGGAANSGSVFNINNLTAVEAGANGNFRPTDPGFGGLRFPDNQLLNSYAFVNTAEAVYSLTLGGFVDANGNPRALTTSNTGPLSYANGNSFTLQAEQEYRLYLFGVGFRNGQNSEFTFDGITKTTNPGQVLVESDNTENLHFVTFDFTTPSDLTGWNLNFTMKMTDWAVPPAVNAAGFNGLALVAIPEPSTFVLLGFALVLAGRLYRRRG